MVKSIVTRVGNQFNVSIAEVDAHDAWQSAVLGIACVSNDASHAHRVLTKVLEMIDNSHFPAHVADYQIEML